MNLNLLKINTSKKKDNIISINNNEIPSYQGLLKNIDSAGNTLLKLTQKNKSQSFDIEAISTRLSISILRILANEHLNPQDKKNRIIIEDGMNKWKNQEKITFPSRIINKKIDQVCIENKRKLSSEEKIKIFDVISEKYKIKTDINSAQSSIVQSLLNDEEITKKINLFEIGKKDEAKNNQINDYAEISRIKGALYNKIAKAVYNTLFFNDKNHPIDFNKLSKDTYNLTIDAINNTN